MKVQYILTDVPKINHDEATVSVIEKNPATNSVDATRYVGIPTHELISNRDFPGDLFLCMRHRMIQYIKKGERLSDEHFNKLLFNHVKYVFVEKNQEIVFDQWIKHCNENDLPKLPKVPKDGAEIANAVTNHRRAVLDLFSDARSEPQVTNAINSSKKIVTEFMMKPYAINNVHAISRYSKGVMDHSVNVSTLAVFLGLRMGYTHQLILENLALGGLFHDLGKTLIQKKGDKMISDDDPEMERHPILGKALLEKQRNNKISEEVLMIVAQHHELMDGTGYPNKLKGIGVYDLARLVTIANVYDNLVSKSSKPDLKDRIKDALTIMDTEYRTKLDPRKMEKAVKILETSLI